MKNKTHPTAYTCEEMMLDMLAAIKEMTPREKAQIRVELQKSFDMPAQPEPDLDFSRHSCVAFALAWSRDGS